MDRLAELRERRALTLRELAEMSGVAADTINQIELGHRKARPSTLRKLARALEVDVREFFEEPALAGKAEAPSPGPPNIEASIYDVVHAAALQQAQREVEARNRGSESGLMQPVNMSPDNDTLDYLLNRPRGEVENALIDLMRDYVRLEHENAQLREERSSVREQERAHS